VGLKKKRERSKKKERRIMTEEKSGNKKKKKESTLKMKILRYLGIGAIACLSLGLTVYILYRILSVFEMIFGYPIRALNLPYWPNPGMGILIGFVFLVLLGWQLDRKGIFYKLYSFIRKLLLGIPGFKQIYGSISSMVGMFAGGKDKDKGGGRVIEVPIAKGVSLITTVTRENVSDLGVTNPENRIAGISQWALQIGGLTLIVDEEVIREIPGMTPAQAMKGNFTGFAVSKTEEAKSEESGES